jgi:hypothetical protein
MTPLVFNCTTTCLGCGGQQTNFAYVTPKTRIEYKKACIHCKASVIIGSKTIFYENGKQIPVHSIILR